MGYFLELLLPLVDEVAEELPVAEALYPTSTAVISPCNTYRYLIEDRWSDGPLAAFIGHNPSIATHEKTDHTKSRVRNLAIAWGYAGMMIGNRFAGGRSPNPGDLDGMDDPVGPDNDIHLADIAGRADLIVVAWGDLFCPPARTVAVVRVLLAAGKPLHCLGTTKAGMPKHPAARGRASIPRDVKPEIWNCPWWA